MACRQSAPLPDALQKRVREQSRLNAATSPNYNFREVWLMAFETQQHSILLPLFERPLLASASSAWVCGTAVLSKEGVYHDWDNPQTAPEQSSACSDLLCTSTTRTSACTHSRAPDKGRDEEQSKQCSHLLENVRSQRVVLCSPPKSPTVDSLVSHMAEVCVMAFSSQWAFTLFWLPLFFKVSTPAKACRTGSHQEDSNRSQPSVHE